MAIIETGDPAVPHVKGIESSLSMSENFEWRRNSVYEVISDDPFEDPEVVFNAVREHMGGSGASVELLSRWVWGEEQQSSSDENQLLMGVDVRLRNVTESRLIWRVTLQYRDFNSARRLSQKGGNAKNSETSVIRKSQEPTDEEPQWGGSFFHVEEAATVDRDGNAVVNSAEQPYDSQTVQRTRDVITLQVNTGTINLGQRAEYISDGGAVNDSTWWGFPPKTVRLASWAYYRRHWKYVAPDNPAAPSDDEGILFYIDNQFEFQIFLGEKVQTVWTGWATRLPDYGNVQLDVNESAPTMRWKAIEFGALGSGALMPGTNLMLDGAGRIQDPQTTLTFNEFSFFPQKDFGQLPIPADLPKGMTCTGLVEEEEEE